MTSYRFSLPCGLEKAFLEFCLHYIPMKTLSNHQEECPVAPSKRWISNLLSAPTSVCRLIWSCCSLAQLPPGKTDYYLARAIHHHLVGRVFAGFCAESNLLVLIWFLRRSISPAMCSVSTGVVCSLSAGENINFPARQLARKLQAINCCQGRGFHRLKLIFCLLLGDSLCKLVGEIQFDFMDHSPGTP